MAAENKKENMYPEYHNRIPKLHDAEGDRTEEKIKEYRRISYVNNSLAYRDSLIVNELKKSRIQNHYYIFCICSVAISFILGIFIGIFLIRGKDFGENSIVLKKITHSNVTRHSRTLNSLKNDVSEYDVKNRSKYTKVSFTGDEHKFEKDIYPKSLTEDMKEILKDNKISRIMKNINKFTVNNNTILFDNIYWGPEIENSIPEGFDETSTNIWEKYVDQTEVVKLESGCGRMQNRLATFKDGVQACVRYRQNTDQIQGEIFSFYVGRLINLTNLAPSVTKVVDVRDKLWKNVASDVAAAQWISSRPVVLTQYIPSLESATIPDIFKPANRHLNKLDVHDIAVKENSEVSKKILLDKLITKKVKSKVEANFDHIDLKLNKKTKDTFVELAQWSDLIIFDYLTANLDRIVNNLFNFQWNVNIMDGPAHNLAKKIDTNLLLFLDNESGLLHGYRLLKKYNVYHSLMLDNLCVFRKQTINSLKSLFENQTVGVKLNKMFHEKNDAVIRDILPTLPEKNAKILHERIGKVLSQVEKCDQEFSKR